MATYDGFDLGTGHVVHDPEPNAVMKSAYFGVTGLTSLDGGGRGRTFLVQAVWTAPDLASLVEYERVLLSYADGVGRVLVDNQGRVWPWVLFEGHYTPNPEGPYARDGGWCLSYRCVFTGLA
jgi:hypothetical protein